MDGYIAEIRMFAATFAPKNWAYCAGQIMAIQQNQALFALIGTTFGGNGINTFGLPDLRGRVAMGTGQGAMNIVNGEVIGAENITLLVSNLPAHNHPATGSVTQKAGTGKIALDPDPTGKYFGQSGGHSMYSSVANTNMGATAVNVQIGMAGANQQVPVVQPYTGMNYIICLYGIFPSRN